MITFNSAHFLESKIIFCDGYCYVQHSALNNVRYMECREKKSFCSASGKIISDQFTIFNEKHNHNQNFDIEKIFNFQKELYITVTSSFHDLRSIYNQISMKHPRASTIITYQSIVRTMQNWRKKNCPSEPESLVEYFTILNSHEWQHLYKPEKSSFTVSIVQGSDESTAIIFMDPILLQNFQSVNLYADATFKVCPQKPHGEIYQFFTIMISIDNSVFPVLWSLMSRKTKACYIAVIRHFKQFTPHLQISAVTTDFEIGLKLAFKEIYPNARSQGCYFHYVQAMTKNCNAFGLWSHLANWEDGKSFFRKLIALILLPANHIQPAFEWLKKHYAVISLPFFEFLKYYESFWIRRIKPENYSVFNVIHKTNNYCEAYNRQLNKFLGDHPSIWQFTDKLKILYSVKKSEIQSVLQGYVVNRRVRPKYMLRSQIIIKAWELYSQDILDLPHFLELSNHIIPVLDNHEVITNENEVNNFIHSPIKYYVSIGRDRYITFEINPGEELQYIIFIEDN